MDLAGMRIIVTGAARGMGAATVAAYAEAGATVVAMDILEDEGRAVAQTATDTGPGAVSFMAVDVSDKAAVDHAFDEAAAHMGGLDVLAHPAAIQRSSAAEETSVEDWDLMFAINVRGTMLTNAAAHGHMKGAGGSIINFGSISGLRPEVSAPRSEEHTSELQSRGQLVCRLLPEKKKH